MKLVLVTLLAGLLAGCMTTRWNHAYKNQSDFQGDMYQCMTEANLLLPPAMVEQAYTLGRQAPDRTTCQQLGGGTIDCTSTRGRYTPPRTRVVDANEEARSKLVNACMFARGYYLEQVPAG